MRTRIRKFLLWLGGWGAGQPVFYFGPLFRLFHGERSAERLDRAEKRDGAMVRVGIALAADHSR